MVRPVHHIAPSPLFGRRRGNSSSSSSLSESPIHSPQTNPSTTGDSPQKEAFNLPPPAYPTTSYGFIGSVPVKIPSALASRVPSASASGTSTPGSQTTVYPTGASIDTLRFGRKPSVTNSVTSPLALAPRCGCGRALGHRARSRERLGEPDISCLTLNDDGLVPAYGSIRMVSDPGFRTPRTPNPAYTTLSEERNISTVLGSSLLSRSRSDPVPPSPRLQRNANTGIHPRPAHASTGKNTPSLQHAPLPAVTRAPNASASSTLPVAHDDRRGRSRERLPPRIDMTPEQRNAKLVHHEEREVAPVRDSRDSRSRGRNSRERSRSRDRDQTRLRSRSRHEPELGLALNLGERPERGRAQRVLV